MSSAVLLLRCTKQKLTLNMLGYTRDSDVFAGANERCKKSEAHGTEREMCAPCAVLIWFSHVPTFAADYISKKHEKFK